MTVSAILDLKETAGFVLVCGISLVGSLFMTLEIQGNHWLKFVT